MSQIDDLSAGDSTPKLAKASLMSLTQVVNRIAYTIKTPDGAVAPDALQISTDGNMSLGGTPLVYTTAGRSFLIQNADSVGNATVRISAVSTSGNAVISVQGGLNTVDSGFGFRDQTGADIAKFRLDLVQSALKLTVRNSGANKDVFRVNTTGEVVIGDTNSVIAKLMIIGGTAANGAENCLFAQSLDPANVPALITGTNGGSLQISGGNNTTNSSRGAQIDFNSGSYGYGAGQLVFRTGTTAGGGVSPDVGRWWPTGQLGVGTGTDVPSAWIHARAPSGTRGRVMSETLGDTGIFTLRRTNGSYTTPTAIQNGDVIGTLNTHGTTGVSTNTVNGSALQMTATQNWSATASGSSLMFFVVANNTTTVSSCLFLDQNGYAGFNTTTPPAQLTVAYGNGVNGYELQTAAASVGISTRNRSTSVFTQLATAAKRHVWSVGDVTPVDAMLLENNGLLAVGTGVASGGTGNTAIEGRIISATIPLNTALTIADSGNGAAGIYSGLKFKLGTRHATSGGTEYFDITTRPGDTTNGVGGQTDIALIRFEASKSLTPRLLLQPAGGSQQVFVGPGTASITNAKLVVECEPTYNGPGLAILGKDGPTSSADLVIRRPGAVASGPGTMPWIQFESTDAAFAGNYASAIGGASNSFQVWNFVSNVWLQKLTVGNDYLISNNSGVFNGKSEIAMHVRGPAATSGNLVLQANTSNGSAYWMTAKTDGTFHIGGTGGSEPVVGVMAINSTSNAVGFFNSTVAMLSYTYAHGGTSKAVIIHNSDTSLNAQSHLFFSTGNIATPSSAIGGLSFVLPGINNLGDARVANIGAATDSLHTAGTPAGLISMATKPTNASTAIPRFVIRASGNVTIGNNHTTDGARLYIYREGRNADGIIVDMSDANNGYSNIMTRRLDTTGYAAVFVVNGSVAGNISHPSATTTSYATSSDQRIKENVKPTQDTGAIIDALEVVEFNMKADGYYIPHGFIAQKLYTVYPTAVTVGDTTLDVTSDSRIWGVDASKLVPVITKEVQSLRKRVAQQDQDIAELRELVNLLLQDKGK